MPSEIGLGQESLIKKSELTPQGKGQQKIEADLTDQNVEPLQMEKRRDAFKDYAYLQRLKSRSLKVKENRDNLDKHEKAIQAKKDADTAYGAEFNSLDDVVADFKTAVFTRELLDDVVRVGSRAVRMSDSDVEVSKQFKYATALQEIDKAIEQKAPSSNSA